MGGRKLGALIELRNVTKKYKKKQVIEDVSLRIPANQITALIGENGTGKSTLLKLIGGLIKADRGEILFHQNHPIRFGYVPEVSPRKIPFTPFEYLTHMGLVRGLSKQWLQKRISYLLEIFQMEADQHTQITKLSKGMKQKVTIMQALLEETDILLLDEPLSGLDAQAQLELEEILLSLKQRNITTILTCHETKLLEKVADNILIIDQRKILVSNDWISEEIKNRLVFELPKTVSIQQMIEKNPLLHPRDIKQNKQVVEWHIPQQHTDQAIKELVAIEASIKLLEPLQHYERVFLNYKEEL